MAAEPGGPPGPDVFVVSPKGNVGIGRADPVSPLDVEGEIRAGSLALTGLVSAGNALIWARAPLNAETVLEADAVGKVHIVTALGAADRAFAIRLPAPDARPGGVITFVVDNSEPSRSRTFSVTCSPRCVDNKDSVSLVHSNVLALMSDGSNWVALIRQFDTDWVDAGAPEISCIKSPECIGGAAGFGAAPTRRAQRQRWRRVGDSMELAWELALTTGTRIASVPGTAPGMGGLGFSALILPLAAQADPNRFRPGSIDNLSGAGLQVKSFDAEPLGRGQLNCFRESECFDAVLFMVKENASALIFAARLRDAPGVEYPYEVRLFARARVPIVGW